MRDAIPYFFFFCYARSDRDAYLTRFFEDLKKAVARLKGVHDADMVGFRDEDGVSTGDDWNSKISAALQISNALVCIYTPSFFAEDRNHEFCAKEVAAFLKRNAQTRYDATPDPEGTPRYQVREARNILPVLWISEKDLLEANSSLEKKLPPYLLRSIQYAINIPDPIASRYKEKGLRRISIRLPSSTREDIITHFARLIISAEALPRLDPPPGYQELWNAFWDDPPDHPALGVPPSAGPIVAPPTASLHGPGHMLTIEFRAGSSDGIGWIPYAGGPALASTLQEVAYDRGLSFRHIMFDAAADDFEAKARSVLEDATIKLTRPILFVDPGCLQVEEQRSALTRLLRDQWRGGLIIRVDQSNEATVRLIKDTLDQWRGGLIIPVDHSNQATVRPIKDTLAYLGLSNAEMDQIIVDSIAKFRTRVISVLEQILARITKDGPVQQKPSRNAGPDIRPRITNIPAASSRSRLEASRR